MNRGDSAHLAQILRVARSIRTFVRDVELADFERDLMRRSAVVSQFIALGLSTRRLSEVTKEAYCGIEWESIEAFAERLIRDCESVHPVEVLHAATTLIPRVLETIDRIGPPPGQTGIV